MEKKLQKVCLVDYKLLLAKDFWQVHYQILLIISLKKFIKLNVNMNMMIKKCGTCFIKYKYCECFFESTSVKDDLIKYRCL